MENKSQMTTVAPLEIESIRIDSFKSIIRTSLNPKRLNIIMGPNNSGKTNLCLALSFPSDIMELHSVRSASNQWIGSGKERIKYGSKENIRCRFVDAPISFEYRIKRGSVCMIYSLWLQSSTVLIEQESLKVGGFSLYNISYPDGQNIHPGVKLPAMNSDRLLLDDINYEKTADQSILDCREPIADLIKMMKGVHYIDLQYNELLKGARSSLASDDISFEPSGSNMASIIGRLFDTGTENVLNFQKDIEELFEIRVSVKTDGAYRSLKVTDARQKQSILSTDEMSHGTLKTIYLTALRYLGLQNQTCIIEELENGLNPALFERILMTLRAVADQGNYVFITTHSPLILNIAPFFDDMKSGFAEVFLTKRKDASGTKVASVSGIIKNKFKGDSGKFWDEVPSPLGDLILTDYFDSDF